MRICHVQLSLSSHRIFILFQATHLTRLTGWPYNCWEQDWSVGVPSPLSLSSLTRLHKRLQSDRSAARTGLRSLALRSSESILLFHEYNDNVSLCDFKYNLVRLGIWGERIKVYFWDFVSCLLAYVEKVYFRKLSTGIVAATYLPSPWLGLGFC